MISDESTERIGLPVRLLTLNNVPTKESVILNNSPLEPDTTIRGDDVLEPEPTTVKIFCPLPERYALVPVKACTFVFPVTVRLPFTVNPVIMFMVAVKLGCPWFLEIVKVLFEYVKAVVNVSCAVKPVTVKVPPVLFVKVAVPAVYVPPVTRISVGNP